jgi:hypothetical protein
MRKLIANRWKTPTGEILQSKHRHDCVSDANGIYFVDGGLDYIRLGGGVDNWEDLCVYSDSPHEEKRNNFYWGTYGKSVSGPIQWVLLKDMQTEHIWNIIRDMQDSMPMHILEMFKDELKYRKEVGNAD